MRATTLALLLCLGTGAVQAQEADAQAQAELTPVLKSESLVFNGITRSKDGRLFSPFQRQQKDKGIELGEWVDGRPVPYPDAAWNGWKTGDDASKAFVGANAIRIGPDGDLWVVDKGAAELGGAGVAHPITVNVADEESVVAMAAEIERVTGGLDLVVSNAGIVRAGSVLEQDAAAFRLSTDINYVAFFLVTKHLGQLLARQHSTAPEWLTDIIQINSKSGLVGSNKNAAYAGSKFGGIGLVQSFALEMVEHGVKVNAICPGNFYDGPLWSDPDRGLFVQYLNSGKVPGAKTVADVKEFYEAKVPMRRGAQGIDVLRAIFYIVEQEYETGQAVPVTGGQVMLS